MNIYLGYSNLFYQLETSKTHTLITLVSIGFNLTEKTDEKERQSKRQNQKKLENFQTDDGQLLTILYSFFFFSFIDFSE